MKRYTIVVSIYWNETLEQKTEKYYELSSNAYEDYMGLRLSLNSAKEEGWLKNKKYVIELYKHDDLKEREIF